MSNKSEVWEFGYEPVGGWYPVDAVKFTVELKPHFKIWVIEHNLDYYALQFLGENALGIDPKQITGEMVIKACLAASWDDASVFFATTFPQLVRSAEFNISDDDEDEEE